MTVEVKTKLTLDDHASANLSHLKEGFKELHEQTEKAQDGFNEMKLVMAEVAGEYLREGIEKAKEFGESFIEAADHGEREMTRLGGLIAGTQGEAWNEAAESAEGYMEKVADVAIDMKVPLDDVKAGFNRLVEIQGATPEGLERSNHQIREMSTLARVLNTNIEAVSGQFAFMEEGTVKVKSQMFQLLQPTGIFNHEGMKATEYWSKLTNESRAELLAKGLDQVSSRLAAAKPTFHDTVVELQNFEQLAKERFGEGLTRALGPAIGRLNQFIERNTGTIDHLAEEMAVDVQHWVDEAVKDIQIAFQYLKDHGQEVKDDIKEAWHFAREVFDYILRHKEVLAIKYVAGTGVGQSVVGAAKAVGSTVFNAGSSGTGALGLAGVAGGTAALGAFALALVGVTAALYEWESLMQMTAGGKSDARQNYEAIQKQFQEMIRAPNAQEWGGAEIAHFNHMREQLTRLAEDIGESSRAAGELADAAYSAHRAERDIVQPVEAAAAALKAIADAGQGGDTQTPVEAITDAFVKAWSTNDEGSQQYIANLLAQSQQLQQAFFASADMTGGGFDHLADLLQDKASEFANKLRTLAGESGGLKHEIKPQMNFSGGQTFKINQDFRDQDPDRIAVLFRSDILKSATNRVQSGYSSPFGT